MALPDEYAEIIQQIKNNIQLLIKDNNAKEIQPVHVRSAFDRFIEGWTEIENDLYRKFDELEDTDILITSLYPEFNDPTTQKRLNLKFYEKMQTLEESVVTGIIGVAHPDDVVATTGFFRKLVHTAQVYTNYKDAYDVSIQVTSADLDVVNGVANNRVILEVQDGVATKRVERVKGEAGPPADPAKLPLYSAIKSANITEGTQFIDDENGNIQYRVLAGQTLLTTELPANVVGTKVAVRTQDITDYSQRFINGFYIVESTGNQSNNAAYKGTQFLPVKDTDTVMFNLDNVANSTIVFYDAAKVRIGGVSGLSTYNGLKKIKPLPGTAFMRAGVLIGTTPTLKVYSADTIEPSDITDITGVDLSSEYTIDGYIKLLDGAFASTASSKATKYLDIADDEVLLTKIPASASFGLAWYDASKVFISSYQNSGNSSEILRLYPPAGAKFYRTTGDLTGRVLIKYKATSEVFKEISRVESKVNTEIGSVTSQINTVDAKFPVDLTANITKNNTGVYTLTGIEGAASGYKATPSILPITTDWLILASLPDNPSLGIAFYDSAGTVIPVSYSGYGKKGAVQLIHPPNGSASFKFSYDTVLTPTPILIKLLKTSATGIISPIVFNNSADIENTRAVKRKPIFYNRVPLTEYRSFRAGGCEITNNGVYITGVTAFKASDPGDGQSSDQITLRSADKGKTWIPHITFPNNGIISNSRFSNGMFLLNKQTNRLFYFAQSIDSPENWPTTSQAPGTYVWDMGYKYSDDDGATWSSFTSVKSVINSKFNVNTILMTALPGVGQGIQMQNGTLVLPTQLVFKGYGGTAYPHPIQPCFLYSTDGGVNWQISEAAPWYLSESMCVETTPGTLVFNCRTYDWEDSNYPTRRQIVTTDMGDTWQLHAGDRKLTTPKDCYASLIKVTWARQDFYLFTNPDNTYRDGADSGRRFFTLRASTDLINWTRVYCFEHRLTKGMGAIAARGDEMIVFSEAAANNAGGLAGIDFYDASKLIGLTRMEVLKYNQLRSELL